jgi:hypothetical protein
MSLCIVIILLGLAPSVIQRYDSEKEIELVALGSGCGGEVLPVKEKATPEHLGGGLKASLSGRNCRWELDPCRCVGNMDGKKAEDLKGGRWGCASIVISRLN